MSNAEQRHELMQGVAAHVKRLAGDFGFDVDKAEQLGWHVADYLMEDWGGQQFTIPKERKYHITKRDDEMMAKFTGNNHAELAREYKMSARAVYSVVKRARQRHVDRTQIKLF
ncbi:Mor transcription activator family protein [uncultured Gilvimarinus sp.]|uniref:Mor transcription activator family protein n=1 Tax=uncultured Gilvimarinus sp. TaxID=1689143 RepID=UPI0030DA37D0